MVIHARTTPNQTTVKSDNVEYKNSIERNAYTNQIYKFKSGALEYSLLFIIIITARLASTP